MLTNYNFGLRTSGLFPLQASVHSFDAAPTLVFCVPVRGQKFRHASSGCCVYNGGEEADRLDSAASPVIL